jgi:predicted TIM-barrel fold metal-dependent hydrolase
MTSNQQSLQDSTCTCGADSLSGKRIDVHHHLSPPAWVEEARARGVLEPLAGTWTVEDSLSDMDEAGIGKAILSITTPGLYFPSIAPEKGRRIARQSNEYGAYLAAQHPSRFGLFATIPLLDEIGSLREIEYALDVLKADGIGLVTSYGTKWLGDPSFFPVMEELNRRGAVVYTHPTVCNCCVNIMPGIPPTMIEFGTDTTRTIASILFDGSAARFPNIRWIFSHAGGSMPFLIERFVRHPILDPRVAPMFPDGVSATLQRFFYDTAQVANPAAMSALTKLVTAENILFGTDFPYRRGIEHVTGLRECGLFDAAQLESIEVRNASRLLGLNRSASA